MVTKHEAIKKYLEGVGEIEQIKFFLNQRIDILEKNIEKDINKIEKIFEKHVKSDNEKMEKLSKRVSVIEHFRTKMSTVVKIIGTLIAILSLIIAWKALD